MSGSNRRIPGPESEKLYASVTSRTGGLSSQVNSFPVAFKSGSGVNLVDVDDNEYLDFSSGIYVASLGHCNPIVSDAIAAATRTLMNCHDFPTPFRDEAQRRLVASAPGNLGLVQFYDNGTTAVEAAIRIARAATGKTNVIAFDQGFHGKTLAAASLGTPDAWQGMRAAGFLRVDAPYPYRPPNGMRGDEITSHIIDEVRHLIETSPGGVAATIVEPIMGWGGSIVPPDDFLPRLSELCKETDTLFIADEVLTCFGRTGAMYAVELWDVKPDLLAVGKSLGNGFPVSAVLVREDLQDAMNRSSASTSYGGNPMACAAICACMDVIAEDDLCDRVATLGVKVMDEMLAMKQRHQIIGDVRGRGFLLGIELVEDPITKRPAPEAGKFVYQEAFRNGLAWIPAGHILRMAPPLVMSEEDIFRGLSIIETAVETAERQLWPAR